MKNEAIKPAEILEDFQKISDDLDKEFLREIESMINKFIIGIIAVAIFVTIILILIIF